MAGVEKVSEVSGIGHGWKMYGYKRNHIQVTPEERKLFRKQKAVLFIFKSGCLRHLEKYGSSNMNYNREFYQKINDRWYEWRTNWKKPGYEYLHPIRAVKEYAYCLYVPSIEGTVNGCFWNWSTEIASVKRRLNRMMKYNVPVIRLDITEKEFWDTYGSTQKETKFFDELFAEKYRV